MSRSAKHFWLFLIVVTMTSGGTLQEILVELAHQHDGPFDEARHFLQQAFILDHFEALGEGEILGFGTDGFGAHIRIDDDVGLVEFLRIVLEAADFDFLRC